MNRYDHLGRRVAKIAPDGAHTFLYDGWRPVVETVAKPGGGTDRIEYHWGKDLSGSLYGAAGVGGLLYVKRNGAIYVPFYDAFDNVMGYWDEQGNVVAEYAYDAFGRTVAKSGTMADVFTIRYSTKYYDAETGMYYYGKRYYVVMLCRWLTRDPIEEQGGVNLYGFCGNNGVSKWDSVGRAFSDFAEPGVGWSFSVQRSILDDDFQVVVKYTMSRGQRRCCERVEVDRYVRKLFGIGNRYGKYVLDHGGERERLNEDPFTGYAEGDTPNGQTLFFYRLPWTQSFKYVARCALGRLAGTIFSTVEKKFKTDGHWLGQEYNGRFVE